MVGRRGVLGKRQSWSDSRGIILGVAKSTSKKQTMVGGGGTGPAFQEDRKREEMLILFRERRLRKLTAWLGKREGNLQIPGEKKQFREKRKSDGGKIDSGEGRENKEEYDKTKEKGRGARMSAPGQVSDREAKKNVRHRTPPNRGRNEKITEKSEEKNI